MQYFAGEPCRAREHDLPHLSARRLQYRRSADSTLRVQGYDRVRAPGMPQALGAGEARPGGIAVRHLLLQAHVVRAVQNAVRNAHAGSRRREELLSVDRAAENTTALHSARARLQPARAEGSARNFSRRKEAAEAWSRSRERRAVCRRLHIEMARLRSLRRRKECICPDRPRLEIRHSGGDEDASSAGSYAAVVITGRQDSPALFTEQQRGWGGSIRSSVLSADRELPGRPKNG
mmetsp:Transcript_22611/g.57262  ORF Transcript_22611/g.57262 Transcript_22611/m.57262 type:complete len:234 (+) Transcript_22611:1870-2571(+)